MGGTKTIDDYCKGEGYQRPTIDQTIFPNTLGVYWSVSPNASHGNVAWGVLFSNGGAGYDYEDAYYYVRAVRAGQ